MAVHKFVRTMYSRKWLVSIKYHFKENNEYLKDMYINSLHSSFKSFLKNKPPCFSFKFTSNIGASQSFQPNSMVNVPE